MKMQAAGSRLPDAKIDCDHIPFHLFFIAHCTHRNLLPCFFALHGKHMFFSYF